MGILTEKQFNCLMFITKKGSNNMDVLYLGAEVKIFSVLIISFLYVFQKKNFQYQSKENKLLYLFLLAEILFSALADVVQKEDIKNTCFALCSVCCFLAVWFFCDCAFKVMGLKKTRLKKFLYIFSSTLFGVLAFYSLSNRINAVNFLLVFAVVALFASEQYNKIRVDSLTKLYNRYGMDVELKEQLRQYRLEHEDSFYIIACDLDNFKHINDTWGHPEGDRALVLVAGVLAKVGKMFSAEAFRIGGDEFVIITDKSMAGIAEDITNAIKAELDKLEFRDDFDIKMSIGTALYDGVTPIDELLSNADKKLYEAKKTRKIEHL